MVTWCNSVQVSVNHTRHCHLMDRLRHYCFRQKGFRASFIKISAVLNKFMRFICLYSSSSFEPHECLIWNNTLQRCQHHVRGRIFFLTELAAVHYGIVFRGEGTVCTSLSGLSVFWIMMYLFRMVLCIMVTH